ncbi:MAG TPA: peptidylprolyl isomerase [Rudaea sp.]|nr:peptidylprolyl isomerase [Rudaea sp.]
MRALKSPKLGAVALLGACAVITIATAAYAEPAAKPLTMSDVLAATKPADWHALDPANTLYLQLATGRVVIELAPAFAPHHVANIKALVREKYFDGLDILRVQDNYVVQWGDPNAENADKRRAFGKAAAALKAEFSVPMGNVTAFTPLPDRDGWAAQTGFSGDFPAARDPVSKTTWLTHCYGTIGVGRDNDADSGSGAELYAVIGGARWLDRNITVVGRVVQGMDLLSSLPRGHGELGFYEKPAQYVAIRSIRLAADVPTAERTNLEILRTDTPAFTALVESRRNRHDTWYKVPAGYIDVCSVPLPVRPVAAPASK